MAERHKETEVTHWATPPLTQLPQPPPQSPPVKVSLPPPINGLLLCSLPLNGITLWDSRRKTESQVFSRLIVVLSSEKVLGGCVCCGNFFMRYYRFIRIQWYLMYPYKSHPSSRVSTSHSATEGVHALAGTLGIS